MLLDIVFSLDSVITAVGMVDERWVMVVAIVIAIGFMLVFAGPISDFVERHPTIKVLALSFLILIGVVLMAEGFGQHIPKGYIYFAMAFSVFVEMLNLWIAGAGVARTAGEAAREIRVARRGTVAAWKPVHGLDLPLRCSPFSDRDHPIPLIHSRGRKPTAVGARNPLVLEATRCGAISKIELQNGLAGNQFLRALQAGIQALRIQGRLSPFDHEPAKSCFLGGRKSAVR